MTISMDKKYRTRDGRDVRLLCVDGPEADFPIIGLISGNLSPSNWHENGAFSPNGHPLDLIEYREPDIRTIWVNVYEGRVASHSSEKEARYLATQAAISIAQPVTFEVKRD